VLAWQVHLRHLTKIGQCRNEGEMYEAVCKTMGKFLVLTIGLSVEIRLSIKLLR
jgi:hypothetical protein